MKASASGSTVQLAEPEPSQLTAHRSDRLQPQPSGRQSLLPSLFLARRHLTTTSTTSSSASTTKKRRASCQVGKEKTVTKDIVCLLPQRQLNDSLSPSLLTHTTHRLDILYSISLIV